MINHQTIREQVYAYIRNQILQLRIKPGEHVLEQDIADELGISRGPVRESLRQLEQEGLLEYRRNRGCIVRKFETEDAAEVFMLRAALECLSVRQCGGVIPESFIQQMEQELEVMKDVVRGGDVNTFFESDERFHSLILQASGLERLYRLWNSLTPLNIAIFLTDNKREKFVLEKQYERHKKILDVLKTEDLEAAEEVINEHYLKTNAVFL